MFKPIQYDSGKLIELPVAAETFTKGDACVMDGSGYYKKAVVDQGQMVTHVIMEDVASAATQGDMKSFLRVDGVVFEADADEAVDRDDVGKSCDLASASTVDVDSVTDKVFYIEDIVGLDGTSTVVRGWFNKALPLVNA